jgi:hypothetical protein
LIELRIKRLNKEKGNKNKTFDHMRVPEIEPGSATSKFSCVDPIPAARYYLLLLSLSPLG